MLYNGLNHVNVGNEMDKCTTQEFKKTVIFNICLNWIISVIYGAIFLQFGTLVHVGYLEGTMSQNSCLGLENFLT